MIIADAQYLLKMFKKNCRFEETLDEVLKQHRQQNRKIAKRLHEHKTKQLLHKFCFLRFHRPEIILLDQSLKWVYFKRFATKANNQYKNIIIVIPVASASASSVSTVQFMYLYRTAVVTPWISFKIYFKRNAEVLQGNAAVLSILHSLKRLITSEINFHRTITQYLC